MKILLQFSGILDFILASNRKMWLSNPILEKENNKIRHL